MPSEIEWAREMARADTDAKLQRRALGIMADELALMRATVDARTTAQHAATEEDPIASAYMRAAEQRRREAR